MSEFTQPLAVRSEALDEITSVASVIETTVSTFYKKIQTIEDCQSQIEASLRRIEAKLEKFSSAANETTNKEWYTPSEVAELVGKKVYTVREWCRLRRINARKRHTGRGEAEEWEISSEEIERYRNHGLLPIPLKY